MSEKVYCAVKKKCFYPLDYDAKISVAVQHSLSPYYVFRQLLSP